LGDDATRESNAAAVVAIALFGILVGLVLFRVTRAEVRSREAAEASESLRGRFFAAMSHELRTPVNAVMGYNDLLLAGIYGPLTEALHRRRVLADPADRFVEELFGLELSQATYDRGQAFVSGVVERAGEDALSRLWASDRELPTPAEIDAPGLWLARIDLPD